MCQTSNNQIHHVIMPDNNNNNITKLNVFSFMFFHSLFPFTMYLSSYYMMLMVYSGHTHTHTFFTKPEKNPVPNNQQKEQGWIEIFV